jgi:cytochrome bd-type quinol oxidase subunit 2
MLEEPVPTPKAPPTQARGLAEEVATLREVVRSLISLQVARGKVAVERSGLALVRIALLSIAGVVLVVAAVVLVVIGSVGALAAVTDWPWWLAALALGLLGPLVATALVQLALNRRDAARARALDQGASAEGSRA